MEERIGKRLLLEYIDSLRYKVENDCLTMEEIDSIVKLIDSSIIVRGTVDEFVAFYGQSRSNVTNVIHRRMLDKSVRHVFYSFNAFRKIVPDRCRYQSKRNLKVAREVATE